MINPRNRTSGFTITELSFAMAGLSILMVILIVSTIGITGIYNKGLTLKAANQSGSLIGQDVQQSLRRAMTVTVREQNGIPTMICTGRTSYVWSVQSKNENSIIENRYENAPKDTANPTKGLIRFARVRDHGGSLCNGSLAVALGKLVEGETSDNAKLSSTEMLDKTLSLRYAGEPGLGSGINFTQNGKLAVFTYTISTTSDDNEDYITDGSRCAGGKQGEFCALNTFTITAYSRYAGE